MRNYYTFRFASKVADDVQGILRRVENYKSGTVTDFVPY